MTNTKALWFTGLSGAGKSTLATAVKYKLEEKGYLIKVFDGDEIRKGINKDLGFSLNDRHENIRRVAEINKLFLNYGINTINAFISPSNAVRNLAREIIGNNRFVEICLTTPLAVCIERDPKGFYKEARNGKLKNFTGVDSVFEASESAEIYLDTSKVPLQQCAEIVLEIFLVGK